MLRYFGLDIPAEDWISEDGMDHDLMVERLTQMADARMAEKAVRIGPENMRMAEKSLLLQVLDQQWKEHLLALDHMKQAVGLRSYAQKDPLNEYKREAFMLFDRMLDQLRQTITAVMSHVELRAQEENNQEAAPVTVNASGGRSNVTQAGEMKEKPASQQATSQKISRNAACPCGSGKKYKHCHGKK